MIILIIVLFSSWLGFSQDPFSYNYSLFAAGIQSYPVEKDPFIAGLLSWVKMGLGQIYCQEYTKGSLFMALDLVDRGALILLISHINTRYSPSGDEIIYVNWERFDVETKVLAVAYFAGTLGLRFYNVIDAVQSANRYNERYFLQRENRGLSFSLDKDRIFVGYKFQFNE